MYVKLALFRMHLQKVLYSHFCYECVIPDLEWQVFASMYVHLLQETSFLWAETTSCFQLYPSCPPQSLVWSQCSITRRRLNFLKLPKLPWKKKKHENGIRGMWTETQRVEQPRSMKEQSAEGENPEETELSSRTLLWPKQTHAAQLTHHGTGTTRRGHMVQVPRLKTTRDRKSVV